MSALINADCCTFNDLEFFKELILDVKNSTVPIILIIM